MVFCVVTVRSTDLAIASRSSNILILKKDAGYIPSKTLVYGVATDQVLPS